MRKRNKVGKEIKSLTIETVDTYFQDIPNVYLSLPETIAYIVSVLYDGEAYSNQMYKYAEEKGYFISTTILHDALKFLIKNNICYCYTENRTTYKNNKRNGRPPIFFGLCFLKYNTVNDDYYVLKATSLRFREYSKIYIE